MFKVLHLSVPWLNVGCKDKMLDRGMRPMLETDWAEMEETYSQIRVDN